MNNINSTTHRSIKDKLSGVIGSEFLRNLYSTWCDIHGLEKTDEIAFRHVEEYPIVKAIGGLSITGRPKISTQRIDYVYLVEPGGGAIYHTRCFTVGVEIKSSLMDLENIPQQVLRYQGHCDYFFVMVRTQHVWEAMSRVKDHPNIGVSSFESGIIYKFPKEMMVSKDNRITMLYRMLLCPYQETKNIICIKESEEMMQKKQTDSQ